MSHWQYHNSVAIRFGARVLDTLPALLAGRRASVVTFPEAQAVGLLPRLRTLVGASLVGVLDALSHALESIWNVHANPISDHHGVAAARLVLETLPALMHDLRNADLRSRMSHAALTAGLAFSNTRTALAHSISYDMTMR